ncbi:MAG TPA: hypothetical protein VGG68_00715 [Caulobacteraceae bacterium]|jgi:hypothetical protein
MATEIDRLVVVFDADFKALSAKFDQVVAKNKAAKAQVAETWTGEGGLKAIEDAFDSLAEHAGAAAADIPGLGVALAALGPAGLAAAAALGALIGAFSQSKKFAEWSDDLVTTAKGLDLTTTQVQEFDHVFTALGINIEAGRQTLKSLSIDIGNITSGVARAQTVKVFTEALKISPDDLKGWGTLEEQLPHVLDAMAKMNGQQLQGFAQRLHLDPAAIATLVDARGKVNDLVDEAHRYGLVVDADMVKKGAELNAQLKTTSQIIDNDMKVAFAGLAPIILGVAQNIAYTTGALNELIQSFKKLDDRNTTALETERQNLLKGYDATLREFPGVQPSKNTGQTNFDFGTPSDRLTASSNRIAQIDAILAERAKADQPPPTPPPTTLVPPKPKPTRTDTTQKDLDEAQAAQANAEKAELQATLALTTGIDARAKIEQQIAEKELEAALDGLEKRRAAAENDKGLQGAKRAATLKSINDDINAAEIALMNAEISKEKLAAQQDQVAKIEANTAQISADTAAQAAALQEGANHLTALAALSDVQAERATYERQALAETQERDRVLADNVVKNAQSQLEMATVTGDLVKMVQGLTAVGVAQDARTALTQTHADQIAAQNKALEDPIQKYQDSLKDLNTIMLTDGVNAAKSLGDSLADALVNAKSFGDAVDSVFRNLLQQIISQMLQQSLISPLLSAFRTLIPGAGIASASTFSGAAATLQTAAGGSDYTRGGLTLVGEQGPELVNMPVGAQVIPNGALRNLGMGKPSSNGTTINFDNRGAVIWEQAARQMMSYADRAAMTAGVGAVHVSRAATPNDLSQMASRRLGS